MAYRHAITSFQSAPPTQAPIHSRFLQLTSLFFAYSSDQFIRHHTEGPVDLRSSPDPQITRFVSLLITFFLLQLKQKLQWLVPLHSFKRNVSVVNKLGPYGQHVREETNDSISQGGVGQFSCRYTVTRFLEAPEGTFCK